MTVVAQILRSGYTTLAQYEIMQRADRLFSVGRYYGGPLTPEHVATLTDGLKRVEDTSR